MKWVPFTYFQSHLSQDILFHEVVDELADFDHRFFQIVRKHLAFLGLICWVELIIITPLLFMLDGSWWYFIVMCLSWAIINYLVVLWIFNHILLQKFTDPDPFERFEAQRHVEKMLFINIGLDVAYVFAGLWLWSIGRHPDTVLPELWTGFGWAVILQGFFLFFQDNFFHRLHIRNIKMALPYFKKLMLSELKNK